MSTSGYDRKTLSQGYVVTVDCLNDKTNVKCFIMIHFRLRDTTVCLPVCLYIYLSVRCHREEKRTEDLLITRNEILVLNLFLVALSLVPIWISNDMSVSHACIPASIYYYLLHLTISNDNE